MTDIICQKGVLHRRRQFNSNDFCIDCISSAFFVFSIDTWFVHFNVSSICTYNPVVL